jgi:hypothetical protein
MTNFEFQQLLRATHALVCLIWKNTSGRAETPTPRQQGFPIHQVSSSLQGRPLLSDGSRAASHLPRCYSAEGSACSLVTVRPKHRLRGCE